jgi:hypothetical protein
MRLRLAIGLLLVFLLAACGDDPQAVALAESACAVLEDVQDESFDPTQLAAYNEWFQAHESELNSLAIGGGSADYEAALQDECGPVVEEFAVMFEEHSGESFWQTSSAP